MSHQYLQALNVIRYIYKECAHIQILLFFSIKMKLHNAAFYMYVNFYRCVNCGKCLKKGTKSFFPWHFIQLFSTSVRFITPKWLFESDIMLHLKSWLVCLHIVSIKIVLGVTDCGTRPNKRIHLAHLTFSVAPNHSFILKGAHESFLVKSSRINAIFVSKKRACRGNLNVIII